MNNGTWKANTLGKGSLPECNKYYTQNFHDYSLEFNSEFVLAMLVLFMHFCECLINGVLFLQIIAECKFQFVKHSGMKLLILYGLSWEAVFPVLSFQNLPDRTMTLSNEIHQERISDCFAVRTDWCMNVKQINGNDWWQWENYKSVNMMYLHIFSWDRVLLTMQLL